MAVPPITTSPGRHWWSPPPPPDGPPTISTGRAYLEVLAVWAAFFAAAVIAAGFSLAGQDPSAGGTQSWSDAVPTAVEQLALIGLCTAVPVLLAARRGCPPRCLGLARNRLGPGQLVRYLAWALLALVAGGAVTSALATGNYPAGTFSYPDLLVNVTHSLEAGPVEEIVVLAFLVTTLEQARRPRAEIVAVALVLRCSYHIYYGPGVVGILVWAAVFLWLFLRFRTVLPLIVLHSAWDTTIFVGDHWHGVIGLAILAGLGVLVAAPITWLASRGQRPTPVPHPWVTPHGMGPPPGWPPPPAWGPPAGWGPPAPPQPGTPEARPPAPRASS